MTIITVNPIADLPIPYPEAGRERWLTDPEIRAFWWACEELGYPYGPMHQLLLLTATRLRETAELPVTGELDMQARVWTLPAARTKPARTFLIPLVDLAVEIINRVPRFADAEFLFVGPEGGSASTFSKAKIKIDKLMLAHLKREGYIAPDGELKHWVVHDLRHTARANFPRLKVATDIAERLLNHKLPGIRGLYDHWEYFDEKKDALERWSNLVREIVALKSS